MKKLLFYLEYLSSPEPTNGVTKGGSRKHRSTNQ